MNQYPQRHPATRTSTGETSLRPRAPWGWLAIARRGAAMETTGEDRSGMQKDILTGNGEWTYRIATGWGALPSGTAFGGTHGAIAQDNAGHIYVSTQSETGVLVYSPEGALLKTIAGDYPEIHSMVHANENGSRVPLLHRPERHAQRELAFHQDEDGWDGGAEDHRSAGGGIQVPERVAPDRGRAGSRMDPSLSPMATATAASFASRAMGNSKRATAAKATTKDYSTAATDWRSIRDMTNRCCWFATGKIADCVTSISTASTFAQ